MRAVGLGDASSCALRHDGGLVCWALAASLDQAPLGYGLGELWRETPQRAGEIDDVPLPAAW